MDTFYAEVAEAAVAAGAHIVNDVSGGRGDSSMLPTVGAFTSRLMSHKDFAVPIILASSSSKILVSEEETCSVAAGGTMDDALSRCTHVLSPGS